MVLGIPGRVSCPFFVVATAPQELWVAASVRTCFRRLASCKEKSSCLAQRVQIHHCHNPQGANTSLSQSSGGETTHTHTHKHISVL